MYIYTCCAPVRGSCAATIGVCCFSELFYVQELTLSHPGKNKAPKDFLLQAIRLSASYRKAAFCSEFNVHMLALTRSWVDAGFDFNQIFD